MSCLKPGYNPPNTRAWNRVQHPCTFESDVVVSVDASNAAAMSYKGNILQYKGNSSNLTKNQRYAQIAKGKWTNRTTTWATQSDKYTQCNTKGYKRANVPNNIYLNGTTTTNPITCDPTLPQDEIIVQDGGTLLCNIQYNPCTGETVVQPPRETCFPTSCSDVPGTIMNLCYNDSLPTYYPRRQYVMNSSGDKWPQGYKDLVSGNDIPSL